MRDIVIDIMMLTVIAAAILVGCSPKPRPGGAQTPKLPNRYVIYWPAEGGYQGTLETNSYTELGGNRITFRIDGIRQHLRGDPPWSEVERSRVDLLGMWVYSRPGPERLEEHRG